MLPWGHAAFGYLVYSLGVRSVRGDGPAELPTVALLVGTQAPDLLDKPLNWWLSVFDGRGAGHSLLVMVPVCLGLYLLTRRYGRGDLGAAFGVGIGSHLLTDAWLALLVAVVDGDPLAVREGAPYLLWPLYPTPTYPKDSPADHVADLVQSLGALPWGSPTELLTSWVVLQMTVLAVPLTLWAYDGFPGVRTVSRLVRRHAV